LIAVALEQSRGAFCFALSKYAHLVIYPVHPNTLDHYRKSFYPSGAKSDPEDAELILDLLVKHPSGSAGSSQTRWKRAHCSSGGGSGAEWWMTKRGISIN